MATLDQQFDEQMMRRAIDLAIRGRGRVEPNPTVGCVIARAGQILGQGWHAVFGGAHAEPTALADCRGSPSGATAYVTLEPCSHTIKKTPPCAPRLIEAGLARVVVGCLDPNPQVNGNGVAMLRAAGITVDASCLEPTCRQLIAPFIARQCLKRPYITLKWARSADGKVAGAGGVRTRISNARSHAAIHELRARSDAILVGINTVLNDDPLLTARGVEAAQRPLLRLVLDSELRIPHSSQLVHTAAGDVVVFHAPSAPGAQRLQSRGVTCILVAEEQPGRLRLDQVINALQPWAPTHLLVEPGPTLARSFFASGLVDRVWVIEAPRAINAIDAPDAPAVPGDYLKSGEIQLDDDRLSEYLNPHSHTFAAADPSADLRLAGGWLTNTHAQG